MAEELNQQYLQADEGAVVPRIKLSESGTTGLTVSNKQILEEANRLFQFPQFTKVVNEMKNDATVASALLAYKTLIGRVDWNVEAPVGASEEMKERAKFVQTCFDDMEHSWGSFITEVTSYLEYGFAIHEKVFRRRLRANGSKFNDGMVGLRKLPVRSQSTISNWLFSDDGRDLIGVEQSLTNVKNTAKYTLLTNGTSKITIPRSKFLLFTCDSTKENPEGRSILKGAYTSYKRLELLQNQTSIGIARDLGGLPCFGIHPRYLDPNASPEEKAVAASFKTIGENINSGAQSAVVMPLMYDPESKQPIFKFELLESKGGKAYDVPQICRKLQEDILNAMLCSQLYLTGNAADNYSVSEGRTNIMALHLSYRLKEIAAVINDDLIPSLFAMNGWTDTELPKIKFSDFDEQNIDDFGKFLQRVSAVGLVEKTRPVLNLINRRMGVPERPLDEPIDETIMTGYKSNSGEGYASATGGLSGTSNSASEDDDSVSNLEND